MQVIFTTLTQNFLSKVFKKEYYYANDLNASITFRFISFIWLTRVALGNLKPKVIKTQKIAYQ